MHYLSEEIYTWAQIADGNRLSELRMKRNTVLELLEDKLTRFDTEFSAIIVKAHTLLPVSTDFENCVTKMKAYLSIFRSYLQKELSFLDNYPYCLAEFWHLEYGLNRLQEVLHYTGIL